MIISYGFRKWRITPLPFKVIGLWALFFILFSPPVTAQKTGDEIIGVWLTQSKESMVEVTKSGNSYTGKVYWIKVPDNPATGKPKTDGRNPDPKLRDRPLVGLKIMMDFKYSDKDKEWDGGTIYDPKSGSTYNCYAVLINPNTLKVRGYIGPSWMGIGRTEIWQKIK